MQLTVATSKKTIAELADQLINGLDGETPAVMLHTTVSKNIVGAETNAGHITGPNGVQAEIVVSLRFEKAVKPTMPLAFADNRD